MLSKASLMLQTIERFRMQLECMEALFVALQNATKVLYCRKFVSSCNIAPCWPIKPDDIGTLDCALNKALIRPFCKASGHSLQFCAHCCLDKVWALEPAEPLLTLLFTLYT